LLRSSSDEFLPLRSSELRPLSRWRLHSRVERRASRIIERCHEKQISFPADRREIKELEDWRGKTLSRVRALVKEADPEVVEEWKWRGVPTWYHDGSSAPARLTRAS
jgi:hypothetical protein